MTNNEKIFIGFIIAFALILIGGSYWNGKKNIPEPSPTPETSPLSNGKDEKYRQMMINCTGRDGETLPTSYCDK